MMLWYGLNGTVSITNGFKSTLIARISFLLLAFYSLVPGIRSQFPLERSRRYVDTLTVYDTIVRIYIVGGVPLVFLPLSKQKLAVTNKDAPNVCAAKAPIEAYQKPRLDNPHHVSPVVM